MDFARRQPMTFFGGSLLAGFALARFLKSSADRRHEEAEAEMAREARSSGRGGSRAKRRKSASAASSGGSAGDQEAAATADANRSS